MFLLLSLLACFDDDAPAYQGPALSFVEMTCGFWGSDYDPAIPEYSLPDGAVVVAVEQCSVAGTADAYCGPALGWFVSQDSGALAGTCHQNSNPADAVIIHYLE